MKTGDVTMHRTKRRSRFWVESAVTIALAGLAVITFLWPDWVEILFKIDPDEGSGMLEWGIVVLLSAATLLAGALAGLEWRRIGTSEERGDA
jgi:hypothetical protein